MAGGEGGGGVMSRQLSGRLVAFGVERLISESCLSFESRCIFKLCAITSAAPPSKCRSKAWLSFKVSDNVQ